MLKIKFWMLLTGNSESHVCEGACHGEGEGKEEKQAEKRMLTRGNLLREDLGRPQEGAVRQKAKECC